jgi:hypothetical protein
MATRKGGDQGEVYSCVHDYNVLMQAHLHVLQLASIVSPNVDMHKKELSACNIGRSMAWILKQHRDNFAPLLWEKLMQVAIGDPDLDALAMGPSSTILMYQGYDITAYTPHHGTFTLGFCRGTTRTLRDGKNLWEKVQSP